MPTIEANEGVHLHYEDRGAGAPVVFVHAWSMDHTLWENQVMALMGTNRVVAYDQRGHGRSEAPNLPHDLDSLASDLNGVLTKLDLDDVRLFGWSLGGFVVLRYMQMFQGARVSKIGYVSSLPKLLADDSWPHGLDPAGMGALAEGMAVDRAATTEQFYKGLLHEGASQQMMDWIVRTSLQTPLFAAMQAFASCAEADLRGVLPELKVPMKLFGGTQDIIPAGGLKWVAEQVPNAEVSLFENSGHFPHLEESAKFNEAMLSFVA